MKFVVVLFRGLEYGLDALAKFGTKLANGTLGYPQRDAEHAEENVEMNLFGVNGEALDLEAQEIRPVRANAYGHRFNIATRFTFALRYVCALKMPVFQRPKYIRNMGEIASASLVLCILIFLTAASLTEPLGLSAFNAYGEHLMKIHNMTSKWNLPYSNTTTFLPAEPAYIPGFYLLSVLDNLPEVLCKDCTAARFSSLNVQSRPSDVVSSEQSPSDTSTTRDGYDQKREVPVHQARPVHYERRVRTNVQAMMINNQLESCALNLLKRLDQQSSDITMDLEPALHDCQNAINSAREKVVPILDDGRHNFFKSTAITKRHVPIYGIIPGHARLPIELNLNMPRSDPSTEPEDEETGATDSDCSKEFCE